ncbi:hypothetical protein R1flu_022790 [Riccia fluitans]|uniref:Uncharacterized protein n=1 Tax=Riccia fluitans TaxID=41844 RepID=A0ABD1XUA0_9MARC
MDEWGDPELLQTVGNFGKALPFGLSRQLPGAWRWSFVLHRCASRWTLSGADRAAGCAEFPYAFLSPKRHSGTWLGSGARLIISLIFRPAARRLPLRDTAALCYRLRNFTESVTDWVPLKGGLYLA